MSKILLTEEQRFWKKVRRGNSNKCWLWEGAVISKKAGRDYGSFSRRLGNVLAHRFSYEISKGSIPEGQFVLHSCDTPRCVNPKHLYLGTQKRNMRDAAARGKVDRAPFQRTKNPKSRFNSSIIMDIRQRFVAGESQRKLAEEYGTDQPYIYRVTQGQVWDYPETPVIHRKSFRLLYAEKEAFVETVKKAREIFHSDPEKALRILDFVVQESQRKVMTPPVGDTVARNIRKRYLRGESLRDLATSHHLTLSQIWDALYRAEGGCPLTEKTKGIQ